MPLVWPPPRGIERQHGRRPLRGAVQRLLLQFESRSSSWRFQTKQLDARMLILTTFWGQLLGCRLFVRSADLTLWLDHLREIAPSEL